MRVIRSMFNISAMLAVILTSPIWIIPAWICVMIACWSDDAVDAFTGKFWLFFEGQ